jgi:beta-ribofuranosylaminobenzene 5'-phosphate synthase
MTQPAREHAVFVEAPARLHFGMLDLRGELGRRFGGIGAGLPTPSLLLEVTRAPEGEVQAQGPDADRAAGYARRVLAAHDVREGAMIRVHRSIPPHAGLGSGTQLGLAVARALAALHGFPEDVRHLAHVVGRARRSAVGTWIFAHGGFVLEGGRRGSADRVAALLARLPFPADWRCVLAVPRSAPGVSGEAEAEAFTRLVPPSAAEVERVAHLVLMGLLPSLAEGDLAGFGSALTEVQRITGGWFAGVQGAAFAPGPSAALVDAMASWGAAGVGQSSWGPAVYGIVADDSRAETLAHRVRSALGGQGEVYVGPFATEGARVWQVASGE